MANLTGKMMSKHQIWGHRQTHMVIMNDSALHPMVNRVHPKTAGRDPILRGSLGDKHYIIMGYPQRV